MDTQKAKNYIENLKNLNSFIEAMIIKLTNEAELLENNLKHNREYLNQVLSKA